MKFNIDEVNKLIRERRSVFPRDYTGEVVDDAIIRQMLENANWAPNHKLTEPWRFVIFSGEGRRKLGFFQGELYKKKTLADGTFNDERYHGLMTKPMESSHVIAVGMKRDEKKRVPEWEELGAVFCAIENMYLTATAYGIGCYLSTGGITTEEGAKAFFGFGEEDKLCGFLHVGVPSKQNVSSTRRPVEQKATWITSL